MDIIVGTAGHIDHGKTALVKALTGVDADRFPEEKERGITIDIGFAELVLGDLQIGFVDVPGHERFVKNMLAGAGGIDVVMLVVAADEGVMPQTREHFEICRLLETRAGLIVLTKKDLVDDELLELVTLDVGELVEGSFLDGAPVIAVSSRTGEGIEALKSELAAVAARIPERPSETLTRLPIDRSFSVRGFGAVVTGTLVSGTIAEGAEMEIMPAARPVRVRGIQSYGRSVGSAGAGRRAAVNLGGIDHSEIERGMVLTERGALFPTQSLDCRIEVLPTAPRPVRSRQRIRIHIGTVEVLARIRVLDETGEIAPGESGLAQVRLERPIVAIPDERFIIRQYSPQTTIGGGRVLDNLAARHRRRDFDEVRRKLAEIETGNRSKRIRAILDSAGSRGMEFSELRARSGLSGAALRASVSEEAGRSAIIEAGQVLISRTHFDLLKGRTLSEILEFHNREPLSRGIGRETLRERAGIPSADVLRAVIARLEADGAAVADKDTVRSSDHLVELSPADTAVRDRLSEIYRRAGLEVPKLEDALGETARELRADPKQVRKIFQILVMSGEIAKVSEEFYFRRDELETLAARLREAAAGLPNRLIDVPQFKELAGISRKYAIPLLEYFDRERVTRRAGDKRIVT